MTRKVLKNHRFGMIALHLIAFAGLPASLLLLPLSTAQAKPNVIFTSPCECENNHGASRWAAKTDLSEPPANEIEIKPITPAEMSVWEGIGGGVTPKSHRLMAEEKWFALTGKIENVRIEDDGDLHIVLKNVDGKPGPIVVEVPLGPRWCEMRKMVFSWTNVHFPVSPGKEDKLRLHEHPVVTVIGKAFYDIDHVAGDTRSNRRRYDQSVPVWEIHPVMKMVVAGASPEANPMTAAVPSPPTTNTAATAPSVAQPGHTSEQFITLTKPVEIQIPYGSTTLPVGTKLPVLSRNARSIDVRYMDARYAIPISSTNEARP